jgi:archaemetzincin
MRVRLLVAAEAPPGLADEAVIGIAEPFTPGEALDAPDLERFRDRVRSQVDAVAALDAVPAPEPGVTNLLLTGADLFVPALTYVFGLSHLGGRRSVLSWARLKPEADQVSRGVTLARRLAIEMTHELGHSAGLVHCARAECPMHRSLWPEAVDMKETAFCDECRSALRGLAAAQ